MFIKDLITDFTKERPINRVFGSQEYDNAAEKLHHIWESMGLRTWIDSVGNVHGIYQMGSNKEVIIGSHLDTVRNGGMFDGLLGIAAATECIRCFQENHTALEYNIHIIATNGEEGNELGGTFGSRCLVGEIDETEEFLEKARHYGISSQDIRNAKMDFSNAVCYLELHIEQGNHLYRNGNDIGIVTGIVGLQRHEITVMGTTNHSGTTLMEYRDDATVKAADIILYGDTRARQYPDSLVSTFGRLEAKPNVLAVINGEVKMVLECRSQSETTMDRYMDDIRQYCRDKYGDAVSIREMVKKSPAMCQPDIIQMTEEVCKRENIKYVCMPSGATHDGNYYIHKIPIGMIFVPSKEGISHSDREWTEWEDCGRGQKVLCELLQNIKM